MNKKMLKNFIVTSKELRTSGKNHEALALSCIVIASCAQKRYPKKTNADQFTQFVEDYFSEFSEVGFPGIKCSKIKIYDDKREQYMSYERMIYKKIRCSLIHQGDLPNISLSEDVEIGNYNENTKVPVTIIDMLNSISLSYLS